MESLNLTLEEAAARLERGELAPEDLSAACLLQIQRLNPRLNAFITVIDVTAGSGARASSSLPLVAPLTVRAASSGGTPVRDGSASAALLTGIPIAVKDLYETAGVRSTAGSLFFKDHVPAEDAHVVQRLRSAGAVILGKTNTHEIALGLTNVNPHFGACRNPWDESRVSGGSSGGSAVAVAAGMALGALGSDTGGSIRVPAALCGVVGLKPTYGRVSLRGVFPLSWNLDHAGPIARCTRDAAILLGAIAGHDDADPASVDVPVDDYLLHIEDGVQGWRVALASGPYIADADDPVLAAFQAAAGVFSQQGARVQAVEPDWLREAALANALMVVADGAAYHRERLAEHPEWFGEDVRQRLQTGAAYSSTEYALARRTQAEVRRTVERFFREYDLLILPTTPIPAPPIEGTQAIEEARRLTRFTAPFNLAGLPAISVPCGFVQIEGSTLPIGLQLVGPHWGEARLLRAARAFERATDFQRRPSI